MGMTANYVIVSALELSEALSGGLAVVEHIWHKKSDQSCCWFLGSYAEEEQLREAKQFGLKSDDAILQMFV